MRILYCFNMFWYMWCGVNVVMMNCVWNVCWFVGMCGNGLILVCGCVFVMMELVGGWYGDVGGCCRSWRNVVVIGCILNLCVWLVWVERWGCGWLCLCCCVCVWIVSVWMCWCNVIWFVWGWMDRFVCLV